ncbi:hypothetical protein [Lentzea sp. NPDC055074]
MNNNDPIHELTQTTSRQKQRIDLLESKAEKLDRIVTRLGKLESKVGDHSVGELQKKIKKIGTQAAETDTRLAEASARVVKLRRDVDILHRTVRLNSGLPRSDYDSWPEITPEMIQLIRTRLAATPVSETEIERLLEQQEKAREQRVQWDKSLEAAIAAVRTLTELPAGAERLWRREVRTWLAFRDAGERPVDKEEQARRRHYEARRAHQAATVAEAKSEAADTAACAVIRERVVAALAQDLVPPPWFESALGLFPPREPSQIRPWLDVATRLIRYRLLAEVSDPVFPYGDRPPDSKLAGERDEVERLCDGRRWA